MKLFDLYSIDTPTVSESNKGRYLVGGNRALSDKYYKAVIG